ncbi:MAG: hypothetical protein CME71_11110 [Halobacteriovorax sp.]|nr:hypothetical protein [Halobacteriovorax sp.]
MNYTPVRISTLKPDKTLPFAVYIYFKERHLLYVKPGAQIDETRYKKLRKQKITKFFITGDQESAYQKYLDQLLDETLSDSGIEISAKVDMIQDASFTALEKLQEDSKSEVAYQMTKTAAKGVAKIVLENEDALQALYEKKSEVGETVVNHCMNVCAISVKLAQLMKCSEKEIETLSVAALIHDIGLTQESLELFEKNSVYHTSEEKIAYAKHTKDGLAALKERDWVSNEIMELVEFHEENLTGEGPHKKTKLSKLEEILSLVNAYDKKILTTAKAPLQAIKDFKIDELGKYDLKVIQNLEKVIKIGFTYD